MAAIRLDEHPDLLRIRVGDLVLAEYVHRPTAVRLESPRPYFSPVRTLGGELVSLFRPHDHVWHTGIAWSLPVVGDENFWGGPTFVRGEGYVQLPNNGQQRHRSFDAVEPDASGAGVRTVELLDWVTEAGETLFVERLTIAARCSRPASRAATSCAPSGDRGWASAAGTTAAAGHPR